MNRHYIWNKKTVHTVIWAVVAVLVLAGTFMIELMSDIVHDNQKLERDLKAVMYDYNELKNKPKPKEYLPNTCLERIHEFEKVAG